MGLFGEILERGQVLRPERLQLSPQLIQTVEPGSVDTLATLPLHLHQPGVQEHLQMLRDRRTADRQILRDLSHRARPGRHPSENLTPSSITQRTPRVDGHHSHNA